MTEVGRVDALLEEVRSVLQLTQERGRFGPVPAAGIREALETVDSLAAQLLALQDQIVLEEYSPDDENMGLAHAQWLMTEAGKQVTSIANLVSASPTLSRLYGASVTFESVYRYAEDQAEVANRIGACGSHPQYVGMLANDNWTAFGVSSNAVDDVATMVRELTRLDVLSGFELEGWVRPKNGRPYWRLWDRIGRDWNISKWRVRRGTVRPDWVSFLRGHWLTAYAYGIALDQFTRAKAPFEIYSNVQYRLPVERGGKSDIDVLVRTADVLLCIECKAGKVLSSFKPNHESAASKTVRNAERIDSLLDSMDVGLQRHYQLIYLPTAEESREKVTNATSETDIQFTVSEPSEVRALIQRIAHRLPLNGSAEMH